jgi:hypothetical protein
MSVKTKNTYSQKGDRCICITGQIKYTTTRFWNQPKPKKLWCDFISAFDLAIEDLIFSLALYRVGSNGKMCINRKSSVGLANADDLEVCS